MLRTAAATGLILLAVLVPAAGRGSDAPGDAPPVPDPATAVTDPVYVGWDRGCVVYRYSRPAKKWSSWKGPKAFLPEKAIAVVGPHAAAALDPAAGYGGWLFDLHAEKWSTIPQSPIAPPRGNMDPVAAAFVGGELVVWGAEADIQGAALDTRTLKWRPIANAPVVPRRRCVTAVVGTKLLVWGGYGRLNERMTGPLDDGAVYDAASDTWAKLPPPPVEGPRYGPAAAESNGRLVLFGGRGRAGVPFGGAVYDVAAGACDTLPDAPLDIGVNGACAADKERLFVWSGSSVAGGGAPGGMVYDFRTRKWSKLPEAPIPPRLLSFARVHGSSLTVWGGWVSTPPAFMMDGATYDALTGTWDEIATLPGDVPYEMHPGW